MRYISIAALALVGAVMTGCSKDDVMAIDKQQQTDDTSKKTVTMTTTVGLNAAPKTRALTGEGVKTFAVGEQMAIVYSNGSGMVMAVSRALKADDIKDAGTIASFTFDLETPDKSIDVQYIYPASMARADGSINYDALANQDGTLASLASNLDLATYEGEWQGENLPSCTLQNQLAILALTLKDSDGANEITGNVTDVTVKADEDTYTVTRSAAAGPIYVAIKPIVSKNVVVTTTGGSKDYVKLLTGKTYASGNGYSVSWRMTPIIPFMEATANDVGRVIAIDGNVYDNTTIATAVNTTAVAIISYVGNPRDAEVGWYRGLAIGMRDHTGGRVVWDAAASAAEDNNGTVVPGGTSGWFLPSVAQLGKVCQGLATKKKGTAVTEELSVLSNPDYTASNLNSIIYSAGGTGFVDRAYCTSTASNETSAWYFDFRTGKLSDKAKTEVGDVRSVIAF
ncbi:hypothetical protein [Prevotella sp. MA2016]|uniref:hypothetical protein n=1 Tax=Prevotella sp. MA2016 TaxID=1408310 RepID=UPI0012DEAFEE|nr:hypothetical protein [Prevotella sp. MA2016]